MKEKPYLPNRPAWTYGETYRVAVAVRADLAVGEHGREVRGFVTLPLLTIQKGCERNPAVSAHAEKIAEVVKSAMEAGHD